MYHTLHVHIQRNGPWGHVMLYSAQKPPFEHKLGTISAKIHHQDAIIHNMSHDVRLVKVQRMPLAVNIVKFWLI